MDKKLQIPDYLVIALMLVVSSAIGIYFRFTGGRQRTISEFLMGDKKMQVFPVSVSLMAAFTSANALLGVPAETYLYGTQYVMYIVGSMIGTVLAMYGMLPVYFDLQINSLNEYLGMRFGSVIRTIAAILQIVLTIFYISVVIYSPSIALNAITGISTWVASICIVCVCSFYCSLGGLKAVLWTDIFQAVLMCIPLFAVIVGGINATGFTETITRAKEGGRFIFFNFSASLTDRYSFWNCIFFGMYLNLFAFGYSQTELQRVLSIGRLRKEQLSIFLGSTFNNIFQFLCLWSGIVLYAIYKDCDPMLSNTEQHILQDQMIPWTLMKFFSSTPGFVGLCVAGIFSASLSTISSAVNAMTLITVEDFLKPYCHCEYFTESRMACVAKILVIVYGTICLLLSYIVSNFRGLLEANFVLVGMIAGPVLGVYLLGLLCKNANQNGALVGLVSGIAFASWVGLGSCAAKVSIPTLSRSISGCLTASNETVDVFEFNSNISSIKSVQNHNVTYSFEDERYIFPLYKLSYFWVPIFGCLTSFISGFIASSLIGCCKTKQVVNPRHLSPFVRKLYFRSRTANLEGVDSHSNLTSTSNKQENFNTFGDIHLRNVDS